MPSIVKRSEFKQQLACRPGCAYMYAPLGAFFLLAIYPHAIRYEIEKTKRLLALPWQGHKDRLCPAQIRKARSRWLGLIQSIAQIYLCYQYIKLFYAVAPLVIPDYNILLFGLAGPNIPFPYWPQTYPSRRLNNCIHRNIWHSHGNCRKP